MMNFLIMMNISTHFAKQRVDHDLTQTTSTWAPFSLAENFREGRLPSVLRQAISFLLKLADLAMISIWLFFSKSIRTALEYLGRRQLLPHER